MQKWKEIDKHSAFNNKKQTNNNNNNNNNNNINNKNKNNQTNKQKTTQEKTPFIQPNSRWNMKMNRVKPCHHSHVFDFNLSVVFQFIS